jgi:hypothetical protein
VGQSVGQALAGIFAPLGYVVVASDGVANVLPTDGPPPDLLQTRIERFDYQDGQLIWPPPDPSSAAALYSRRRELVPSTAVLDLPQIAAAAKKLGLQPLPLPGLHAGITEVHFSFHLRGVTLFQLLNAVVAKSPHGMGQWKYIQQTCGGTRSYLLDITNM